MGDIDEHFPINIFSPTFADDITVGAQGRTPRECTEKLQPAIDAIADWAEEWKVLVSTSKTVCTLFTLDPVETNGKVKPRLHLNGELIPHDEAPKLLGVRIDGQLTFGPQCRDVKIRLQKRLKVLRALTGRTWGRDTKNLRSLYIAYGQSVATYCNSTWMTMASDSNRNKVAAEHNKAARIITGCVTTTPIPVLLQEADLIPLDILAERQAAIHREKLLRLPPYVPARTIANHHVKLKLTARGKQGEKKRTWRDTGRNIADLLELENTPREDLLPHSSIPPWNCKTDHITINADLCAATNRSDAPAHRKKVAVDTLDKLPTADITCWTDGSAKGGTRKGGAGIVIDSGQTRTTRHIATGELTSSYRSEMTALRECLAILPTTANYDEACEIRICTDSKSSLQKLEAGPAKQEDVCAQQVWSHLLQTPADKHITLQWVPGHCDLEGNEGRTSSHGRTRRSRPHPHRLPMRKSGHQSARLGKIL
jgi:ribonuclease HI